MSGKKGATGRDRAISVSGLSGGGRVVVFKSYAVPELLIMLEYVKRIVQAYSRD